jgi:hypothetical protein
MPDEAAATSESRSARKARPSFPLTTSHATASRINATAQFT